MDSHNFLLLEIIFITVLSSVSFLVSQGKCIPLLSPPSLPPLMVSDTAACTFAKWKTKT